MVVHIPLVRDLLGPVPHGPVHQQQGTHVEGGGPGTGGEEMELPTPVGCWLYGDLAVPICDEVEGYDALTREHDAAQSSISAGPHRAPVSHPASNLVLDWSYTPALNREKRGLDVEVTVKLKEWTEDTALELLWTTERQCHTPRPILFLFHFYHSCLHDLTANG